MQKLWYSHCNSCKQKSVWPNLKDNDVHTGLRCPNCGDSAYIQFYSGKKEVIEKMVEEQKKKTTAKAKKQTDGTAKTRGYDASVKDKCVALAKKGKTLAEIVSEVKGPKAKAVLRYLKAAGVELAEPKESKKAAKKNAAD